jgi:predicted dehydrogenase
MPEELRFGVFGAGQISHVACEEIARHPAASVVALSDPHPERLAKLAAKVGSVRAYADNRQLLADPDVSAVYIATPNAFHAPLALAALAAGKHVLIEKPFALDAVEAAAVVAASERSGKLLSIGMNLRFNADSQRLAALVRRGALGQVYHAKAFWFRRAGIPKLGTWFSSKALAGGGALYDIGVHLLDLSLFALDRFDPVSVSGRVYSTFGGRGLGEGDWGHSERSHELFDVDDSATALLRFADGATLTLDVSWAIHQKEANRMNVLVHGSEGGAGCFPGEHYRFGAELGSYEVAPLESSRIELEFPHENRFFNFIGAALGRERLCVTASQALAVQRILDAIYESSRLGREVMLSQP